MKTIIEKTGLELLDEVWAESGGGQIHFSLSKEAEERIAAGNPFTKEEIDETARLVAESIKRHLEGKLERVTDL